MLCSCPSDELGEIFKEMGMSAQDRRFLLMSIKEWKDKPVCSCVLYCTARSDAPSRAIQFFC